MEGEGEEMVKEGPVDEKVRGLKERIQKIENRITQCDMGLTVIKEADGKVIEKAQAIEKNIQELLSIYEVLTNEINPFVERIEFKPRKRVIKKVKKKPGPKAGQVPVPTPRLVEEGREERPLPVVEAGGETGHLPGGRIGLTVLENDPGSIILVYRWLDFLLKRTGRRGLLDCLLHYEKNGWINAEVRNKLLKYAKGIETPLDTGGEPLDGEDHLVSLYFIAKLQGIEVDPEMYSSVIEELRELDLID